MNAGHANLVEDGDRRRAHRGHALPGLLDDQRVVHPATAPCAEPPDLFPRTFTLDGYARRPAATSCPTSARACSSASAPCVLTLRHRRAGRLRPGQAVGRGRRLFNFLLLVAQMIPAVIMALGFYAIYLQLGILNTCPG